VHAIAERLGRSLERGGLITRDIENAYLAFDPSEEAPIHGLLGYSITYRIATGPREGQKVFLLQTLPAERGQVRYALKTPYRDGTTQEKPPHQAEVAGGFGSGR
jgi:hypothetical protein